MAEQIQGDTTPGDVHVRNIGLFFGMAYFAQGLCDPAAGLMAQPLRRHLGDLGYSVGEIAQFLAVISIPWTLKPFYGLVTDFIHLLGRRRKSYLILAGSSGLLALILQAANSSASMGPQLALGIALSLVTFSTAFHDVIADALMVEVGQPQGKTAFIQSVQWTAMNLGTILVGILGGFLAQMKDYTTSIQVCLVLTFVNLVLSVTQVEEPRVERDALSVREESEGLVSAMRSPAILAAAGFLVLWSFNPFSNTVCYGYLTGVIGMNEQSVGFALSILAFGSLLGSSHYGFLARRLSLRSLLRLAVVSGVLSTLCYALVADRPTAYLASFIVGYTYLMGCMVQFDLCARCCPPRFAGTLFASLMALSNLSLIASDWIGGAMFDTLDALIGHEMTYQLLIIIGSSFSLLCLILVPVIEAAMADVLESD